MRQDKPDYTGIERMIRRVSNERETIVAKDRKKERQERDKRNEIWDETIEGDERVARARREPRAREVRQLVIGKYIEKRHETR